ncbi:unnamed protein product, partial [Heterosigma akashiwo]
HESTEQNKWLVQLAHQNTDIWRPLENKIFRMKSQTYPRHLKKCVHTALMCLFVHLMVRSLQILDFQQILSGKRRQHFK